MLDNPLCISLNHSGKEKLPSSFIQTQCCFLTGLWNEQVLEDNTFCQRVLRVYQLVSAQDFEHAKGYCVWMPNGIKCTAVIPNRLWGTDLPFPMREQELCRFCTNQYPSVLKPFPCRLIDTQCTWPQCMAWTLLLLLSSTHAVSSFFFLGFTLELWGRFCESDSRLIWNWNMTKSRIFSHTVTA